MLVYQRVIPQKLRVNPQICWESMPRHHWSSLSDRKKMYTVHVHRYHSVSSILRPNLDGYALVMLEGASSTYRKFLPTVPTHPRWPSNDDLKWLWINNFEAWKWKNIPNNETKSVKLSGDGQVMSSPNGAETLRYYPLNPPLSLGIFQPRLIDTRDKNYYTMKSH